MADKTFKLGIVIDSKGAIQGIEDASGAVVDFTKQVEKNTDTLGENKKGIDGVDKANDEYAQSLAASIKASKAQTAALQKSQKSFEMMKSSIKTANNALAMGATAQSNLGGAIRSTNTVSQQMNGTFAQLNTNLQTANRLADTNTTTVRSLEKQLARAEAAANNFGKTGVEAIEAQRVASLAMLKLKRRDAVASAKSQEEIRKINKLILQQRDAVNKLAKSKQTAAATKLSTPSATKGMGGFSGGLGKATLAVTFLNQALGVATAVFRGLLAVVNGLTSDFREFEVALVGVAKTANLGQGETENLGKVFRNLSTEIPVAASELARMGEMAGQLGVKGTKNIALFAETMARVTSATDLSGDAAATQMARIINVTGEGIDTIDEFASVIVALGNESKATESEILRMANEIARGSAIFKVSSGEAAAIGAAMRSMGVQAELAGSSMGDTLNAINSAIKGGGKEMEALQKITGKTADELKKQFGKSATETFRTFVKGLGELDPRDVTAAMAELGLEGQRFAKTIAPLSQNVKGLDEAFAVMGKELGKTDALMSESDKAFSTFDAAIKKMKNSVDGAFISIGASMAELFTPMIDGIAALFSRFSVFFDAWLPPIVAGIKSFLTPLGKVLDLLTSGLGLLMKVYLIPMIHIWQRTWEVMQLVIGATNHLIDGVVAIGNAIKKSLMVPINAVIKQFKNLINAVPTSFLDGPMATAKAALNSFNDALGDVAQVEGGLFKSVDTEKFTRFLDSGKLKVEELTDASKKATKSVAGLGGAISSVVSGGGGGGGDGGKEKKDKSAPAEKLTDAQRDAAGLLDKNIDAMKSINEFGKEGIDLINLQKNARLAELAILQQTLMAEGNLSPQFAKSIKMAEQNAIRMAGLKIGDEEKKKSLEAAELLAEVSDRTRESSLAASALGKNQLQLIATEVVEKNRALNLEREKLKASGDLTSQLNRNFNQMVANNKAAGAFEIAEVKTDSIEQLRGSTQALLDSGLEGDALAQRKLEKDLASVEAKREELKLAGMLTPEAKKLLAVQEKELTDQASGPGFDFSGLGDSIADGFSQGVDMMGSGFDALSGIMDSFGSIGGEGQAAALTESMAQMPLMIAKGMEAFPETMIKAVDSFVEGLDSFVQKVPEMLTKILDALPMMIDKLFAAFGKLVEALPAIFMQLLDALPGIITKILEKLPDMIIKILNSIGDIIVALMDALPGIIVSLAENIGPIVEALVEGLVSNIGKIAIGFVDSMILKGGLLRIAVALAKAIVGIIPAIVKGLAKGLGNIFKGLTDGIKIPLEVPKVLTELPEKLSESVKGIGEKASSSGVFAVVDLQKTKAAKTIDKSIGDATKRAAKAFKQTFKTIGGWLQKLWEALRAVWEWVVSMLQKLWDILLQVWEAVKVILQVLWDALQAVWDVVVAALEILWDAIKVIWEVVVSALEVLWEAIKVIWETVVSALQVLWEALQGIWDAVIGALQGVFDFVAELFQKYTEILKGVFEFFKKIFSDAISGLTGFVTKFVSAITSLPGKAVEFANKIVSMVGNIGSTMWNSFKSAFASMGGVISDHLKFAFEAPFKAITGVFSKVFEGVPDGGSKGPIESLMNTNIPIIRFAEGGVVPGVSPFPGDNKKNDSMVALLSPGEAVIPRTALADPQIARLVQSIMEGNVKFAFGGMKSPVKISAPKISAPKLPSINDIKKLSPADLAKNIEANLKQLQGMLTGDLWDMFKDTITGQVKIMMETIMKSAGGFETGGMVENTGVAMVHRNEAVLPTDLVDKILGNSGSKQQAPNITLNATVNMIGADVAGGKQSGKAIIDQMFVELRKRSANSKVMFESGLIA